MTFGDVRKIALAWPEVEDGMSYGTPALKVRKKLLARLREDNESLVMFGVPLDERDMLIETRPKIFYFTDHYRDYPTVLIGLSKAKRAMVEPLLRGAGGHWRQRRRSGNLTSANSREGLAAAMDKNSFLAAALRNPANETIARELFESALPDAWIVSGCLVQTVWNVLTGRAVDYGINDYDVFYFDPDTSWAAEDAVIRKLQQRLAWSRRCDRGAQPGPRPSLVSGKAFPALSAACRFDRRHRPLSHQQYPSRNPPQRRRLRRLCAKRI